MMGFDVRLKPRGEAMQVLLLVRFKAAVRERTVESFLQLFHRVDEGRVWIGRLTRDGSTRSLSGALPAAAGGVMQRRYAIAFALGLSVTWSCRHMQVALPAVPTAVQAGPAAARARGESIVRNVAVCGHCHAADPKRDVDGPLSGGMEFNNWRFGTARASNLTSDIQTGLGTWSEAEIVRALRNGVRKDGRLLIPVMPYEWFHEMADEDAFAVAQYLKSLAPVRNAVRQSPNIWFKIADLLFLGPEPPISASAPPRGATVEYGRYLSQHLGLCADCHTPRGGIRSAPDKSRLFAGMRNPPEGFPANPSNLTPDPETGIGRWSESDFLQTIRTGVNPSGRLLHRFMPWPQIGRMPDDDLRAIYRYLRTVTPIRNEVPRRPPL
jgi:cytochrome c553